MWKNILIYRLKYGNIVAPNISRNGRYIPSVMLYHERAYGRSDESHNRQISNSSADSVQKRPLTSVLDPISSEMTDVLKSFIRIEDVLQFLKDNPNVQTSFYKDIFSTIHKLQKFGLSNVSIEDLTRNPTFENLCVDVKKNVRFLNASHALNIFKTLMFLKVSSNSLLGQNLLQMISKHINKLSLSELTFLNFLLINRPTSPLVESLKMSIPIVFEANVRFQLDQKKKSEVFYCFLFAFKEKKISRETRDFLINVALEIHEEFTPNEAVQMLFVLCQVNQTSPDQMILYNNLINGVANTMQANLKFPKVNALLDAVIGAYIYFDESYFHEQFVEKSIDYVISQRLSILDAGKLLRNLSRISYPCYKLLDYVDEKLAEEKDFDHVKALEPFISFLSCCSNCSYKPKNWPLYQEKLVSVIDQHKSDPIPLLKIVVDLVVMKCWVTSLIEYCFREEFIQQFLKRERNLIDQFCLLRLYQVVQTIYPGGYKYDLPSQSVIKEIVKIENECKNFPLEGALINAFGGSKFVLSGVGTRYGHFIDHLIVKRKTGKMVVINEDEVKGNSGKLVESLEVPEESLLIGILLLTPASYCLDGLKIRGKVKLKIHSLEALGFAIIPISKVGWLSLPDHEKLPYLLNKIETRTFARNFDEKHETLIHLD